MVKHWVFLMVKQKDQHWEHCLENCWVSQMDYHLVPHLEPSLEMLRGAHWGLQKDSGWVNCLAKLRECCWELRWDQEMVQWMGQCWVLHWEVY